MEQSDWVELMEEIPGGENHGWSASINPEDALRSVRTSQTPLNGRGAQVFEFLRNGGWSIVHSKNDAGMTAHRGVLHPDEYVDQEVLLEMVEEELGFTAEQIRGLYRQGPLSDAQRAIRDVIDARMLAVAEAGGNISALGKALGFPVTDHGNCRALNNGVSRARARRIEAHS